VTRHTSSTLAIPEIGAVPRHIAIIMDGNGRWAKNRFLPRVAGHKRGVEAVRAAVKGCAELGVEFLTLFAFSSENWRRPEKEVSVLMQLFVRTLEQEVQKLHENGIRFRVIGDLGRFEPRLRQLIAANYGGRWDILQAVKRMLAARPECAGGRFSEAELIPYLSMWYAPEPDLFIRTGGEKRISNFLVWQLAYTELYFTDTLWPDFDRGTLARAIDSYCMRERRFGRTSEQLKQSVEVPLPVAKLG
jgi:undecaprenyl diphosphate synthase